jgi:chorismate synthase
MNSFGRIFRIHIFGESHGENIGVVIDGCQEGISLQLADFGPDLARRRSGAKGTTARCEPDEPKIVSGIYNGHTTGAPLAILFGNHDTHSDDYAQFRKTPRPGQPISPLPENGIPLMICVAAGICRDASRWR